MPIPKPHDSEPRADFMSRCMGDTVMNRDYAHPDQRYAVCSASWDEARKDAIVNAIGTNQPLVPAQRVKPKKPKKDSGPCTDCGQMSTDCPGCGYMLGDCNCSMCSACGNEQAACKCTYCKTCGMPLPMKGLRSAPKIQFWKDKETGMKIFGVPMEVKDVTEAGTFEGLASVYGNVDLGGDIVMPGAFKRENMKLTKDGKIRILDGHNTRAPIGKGELMDSHLGLVMKGYFEMAVARAREVHALMKSGIIDGLSIGYDINEGGAKFREDGKTRELTDLTLWEVSTTPFPMNQSAVVSSVKQIVKVTSVRELEDLLRDATGLSRSKAKLHSAEIWKTLNGPRDAGDEGDEATVQRMTESLKGFAAEYAKK